MPKANYRKCAGCGEIFDRDSMIKLTADYVTKKIIVTPDNKTFGRSAYICKNQQCIDSSFKKNKIFKSLRIKADEDVLKIKEATLTALGLYL